MRKGFNDFIFAINSLFATTDGLFYVTDGKISRDSIGKYQGPLDDRANMRNDMRNVYSDMNSAMKLYGQSIAK
jgi:hypothetical protein